MNSEQQISEHELLYPFVFIRENSSHSWQPFFTVLPHSIPYEKHLPYLYVRRYVLQKNLSVPA